MRALHDRAGRTVSLAVEDEVEGDPGKARVQAAAMDLRRVVDAMHRRISPSRVAKAKSSWR